MSAPVSVRTSSRIKERKSKVTPPEKDANLATRKRRNSREEQAPAQQATPAKKNAATQQATPSPAHSVCTPATPATPTAEAHNPATPIATPAASTSGGLASSTISTRSSQRLTPKEETPSKSARPAASASPPAGAIAAAPPPPATAAIPAAVTASTASVTSCSPPVQQTVALPPPTHIFKNPNFTHSSRGGTTTGKKTRTWKTLKQIITSERTQIYRPIGSTYSSIDAPPSRKPAKKYSDISGMPAKYTDPRTKLRYATTEEFAQLRMLPTDIVNGLLSLRRANLEVQ